MHELHFNNHIANWAWKIKHTVESHVFNICFSSTLTLSQQEALKNYDAPTIIAIKEKKGTKLLSQKNVFFPLLNTR